MGVAEKQAVGAVRIPDGRGKKACGKRSPEPADSVDADNVQGIVIAKFCLHQNSSVTERPGNEANDHG